MSESNEKRYSLLESNSDDIREGRVKPAKPKTAVKKTDSDKKKKFRIYIIAVVAVSVLLACMIIPRMLYSINESLLYELTINETNLADFTDGEYSGGFQSSHMSAVVTVTVVSGRIEGAALEAYSGISPTRAKEVFERVIYYQMLNIPEGDSAGIPSQPTDFVVLKAIEAALSSRNYTGGVSV